MSIPRTYVGIAVLAAVLMGPGVASAQVQVSAETQLAQRAAQSPHDISSLLDLARLYFEQHRYEDASRTLSRAMAVIQQEQLLGAQPAATTNARTTTTTAFGLEQGQPLRVGGDVKEPKKIKDVAPIYPQEALAAKLSGYVIIETIIGPDGQVNDAKVIRSQPLLDQAELDAVRQWRYAPSLLNGAPISVIMAVTVIFSLK